jgi:hypothetical protein
MKFLAALMHVISICVAALCLYGFTNDIELADSAPQQAAAAGMALVPPICTYIIARAFECFSTVWSAQKNSPSNQQIATTQPPTAI